MYVYTSVQTYIRTYIPVRLIHLAQAKLPLKFSDGDVIPSPFKGDDIQVLGMLGAAAATPAAALAALAAPAAPAAPAADDAASSSETDKKEGNPTDGATQIRRK